MNLFWGLLESNLTSSKIWFLPLTINFDHNSINNDTDIDLSLETVSMKASIYFLLINKVKVSIVPGFGFILTSQTFEMHNFFSTLMIDLKFLPVIISLIFFFFWGGGGG